MTSRSVPTKRCSRLFVLDETDRLFLFRYESTDHSSFWATAGGELRGDEGYLDAAKRELSEETGFVAEIGRELRTRNEVFCVAEDEPAYWKEKYFLVRVDGGEPVSSGWSVEERRTIREARWWSLTDLQRSQETFLPGWLAELLAEVST